MPTSPPASGSALESAAALLDALESSEPSASLETSRQVFVNRDLRLDKVNQVGFDMDYTLAIYKREPMEELQYELTVDKLVRGRGYPEEIRTLPYDQVFVIRGLVVDKALGNVLKMDSHGHVGRVFHGRRALSSDHRRELYRKVRVTLSNARRFASLDTLFSMPETCLFANLVDFFENRAAAGASIEPLVPSPADPRLGPDGVNGGVYPPDTPPPTLNYFRLFDDIRDCIDEAHRDDSLKSIIKQDIGKFVFKDPELPLALHKLRSSGKRLFLLTNSFWDYTDHVMTFLVDGVLNEYASWRQFFDVVVVGSGKPRFFNEHRPFLEVDPSTGETRPCPTLDRFERGHVYQGGNIQEFERRTGARGDETLYVGDHIFGDILRSKKDSLWRTALVVQELEEEIQTLESHRAQLWALADLDRRRYALEAAISHRMALLARVEHDANGGPPESLASSRPGTMEMAARLLRRRLDEDKRALKAVSSQAVGAEQAVEAALNPYWGMVFKEGRELSRFGEQVEDYACVYTSRVSNFLYYSPMHFFRTTRTQMHHEQVALAGSRRLA